MPLTVRPSSAPAHQHGQAPFTAVLLCNLGTPDAPTAPAVRKACVEERGLDPHHFFSDVFVPGPAA